MSYYFIRKQASSRKYIELPLQWRPEDRTIISKPIKTPKSGIKDNVIIEETDEN